MEEMKNNVYKDVLFELRMFYCVDTNNDDVTNLVRRYIDENYNEFRALIPPRVTGTWYLSYRPFIHT
jgi:hypothetical protein